MLDNCEYIRYNTKVEICAAMAQVVEHILGKDEVTSSNLVSSSKNPSDYCLRDFYFSPITLFKNPCAFWKVMEINM